MNKFFFPTFRLPDFRTFGLSDYYTLPMPLFFIAIVLPEEINRRVLEWKQYMLQQFGCKTALKSQAHITLIAPFEMQEQKEAAVRSALQNLSEQQKEFQVVLKDFSCFKPRVIFLNILRNDLLQGFKQSLEEYLLSLKTIPVKKETRPFHPHITIANRDLKKDDFRAAWNYFEQEAFYACFPAKGISLLKHNGKSWIIVFTSSFYNYS